VSKTTKLQTGRINAEKNVSRRGFPAVPALKPIRRMNLGSLRYIRIPVSASAGNSTVRNNPSVDSSTSHEFEPCVCSGCNLPDSFVNEQVLSEELGLGELECGEDIIENLFVDLWLAGLRELGWRPAEFLKTQCDLIA
jgi:hypothetical protein